VRDGRARLNLPRSALDPPKEIPLDHARVLEERALDKCPTRQHATSNSYVVSICPRISKPFVIVVPPDVTVTGGDGTQRTLCLRA
jgi:hypothetical protein